MRPKYRYETVELLVPAGFTGNKVNFNDIPELRSDSDKDALIFSIVVNDAASVPLSYNGNTVSNTAQIANAFLTLYILGAELWFNVPLSRFVLSKGNGATYFSTWEMIETEPLRVDWTKSYISFGTPPNPASNYVYLFEFGYDWFPPSTLALYLKAQNQVRLQGVIKGY